MAYTTADMDDQRCIVTVSPTLNRLLLCRNECELEWTSVAVCRHEVAKCIEAFGVRLEPGKQRELSVERLLKRDVVMILWVPKAGFLEERREIHQRKAESSWLGTRS